jgi:hypothetical protein
MITPEIVGSSHQLRCTINAADLTALLTAIGSAGVVTLPEGKTLADLTRLSVSLLPALPNLPDGTPRVRPDGAVAQVMADIKA